MLSLVITTIYDTLYFIKYNGYFSLKSKLSINILLVINKIFYGTIIL